MGTPSAEVTITPDLVRALLESQCPEYATTPVLESHGWDNDTYRLGDRFAARLPRRRMAVPLIEHEQRWLPRLADTLPVPIPVPLFRGRPGAGYPWSWSVVPWIDGTPAEVEPLAPSAARPLGEFLRALHTAAPPDAPHNPYRGVPLAGRADGLSQRIAELTRRMPQHGSDLRAMERRWADGLAAPPFDGSTWIHGDLHPRNILTNAGDMVGVIDWGDIASGDPATDLAAVWMHFEPEDHDEVWRAYGRPDDATYARALAWAISFMCIFLGTGLDDDPGFLDIGEMMRRRIVATG